jgi:hypothetical protein
VEHPVAHRPIARVEDVRGMLGLSDAQYATIAGGTSAPALGIGID